MSLFFISDLHLQSSHPEITDRFLQFLAIDAKNAKALYILGDFFETWIGEDGLNPHDQKIMQALANYANHTPTYFMQGNRDFLISAETLKHYGVTLLNDPHLLEFDGKRILLMHGDTLCTKDFAYQRFRRFVRHPFITRLFLNLPLFIRKKIARMLRKNSQSMHAKPSKDPSLYDATREAIEKVITEYQADILIHGHTHQPQIETMVLDNKSVQRIVLGDWGPRSTILKYSVSGGALIELN